jgi:hypothetical protein
LLWVRLDEVRGEPGVVADILETLRVALQPADRRSLMCRAGLSGANIWILCAGQLHVAVGVLRGI